jgi:dihydroorotate dehydrogenase (NAD+) catalytic subunit
VSSAEDALQYLVEGANLVGIGTAMLRDPRAPESVVAGLARWCAEHGVKRIGEVVGALEVGA